MEGKGIVRPPWLGFAVHVLNSIIAWTDLVVIAPAPLACGHPPVLCLLLGLPLAGAGMHRLMQQPLSEAAGGLLCMSWRTATCGLAD